MSDTHQRIDQLLKRLELLSQKQLEFSKEINLLRAELRFLQSVQPSEEAVKAKEEILDVVPAAESYSAVQHQPVINPVPVRPVSAAVVTDQPIQAEKSNLERFVGENLINKVGIAITIIGVAIGAKYSIDNNLISPLTRIIMGYLFGVGLLVVGIRLKAKYINFSAVLVSGAMAIMYFLTYAAYSFYGLIPQTAAFIIMVVFTIFTVMASLQYNREVIALIGMVGAYAVPFLLSDGSGKVVILFSYMSILNIGILAVAIKRYWKLLYYSSFVLTAAIFSGWYGIKYVDTEHFNIGVGFLSLFFTIFYFTFLTYKLRRAEKFEFFDIAFLLINAFGFYGFGFSMLADHGFGSMGAAYFTLFNALIHLVVGLIVYRIKGADVQLQQLLAGLTVFFIAISFPIALSGSWVSLSWAGVAALLFWIGRSKGELFYEKMAYPLMYMAFLSVIFNWYFVYPLNESSAGGLRPFLNVYFLESLIFIGIFGFINWVNNSNRFSSSLVAPPEVKGFFSLSILLILIISIYLAIRLEISSYWEYLYEASAVERVEGNDGYKVLQRNQDYHWLKALSILNYSMVFMALLSMITVRKSRNQVLSWMVLVMSGICLLSFLTQGLFALGELRESYLGKSPFKLGYQNISFLLVRYLSYAVVAWLFISMLRMKRVLPRQTAMDIIFDMVLHTTILWIASSELVNILELSGSSQSYKLGLSILWGVYSLLMIVLGIWKKNQPLRIASIVLFAVTLIKLFIYDIIHLNTISKTIVLVSLGVLLLVISFLYNKYKHLIANEPSS